MPANTALSGTELSHLNSPQHDVPYYLSYRSDVVIATADVATTPNGASYAVIAVTNTINWTKIRQGMTAKITNSAATVLRGYYRVRNGGNPNALLIEQIAFADPGSIANSNRSDIIQSGDKVTILERFDLYSMKPFSANSVIYQDFDIAVGTHNTQPEPIVNIQINSRPGDYVTMIASDGGTQAITAVATVSQWPTGSGATVGYAWTVPASWSSVGGAGTSTLTANVPPGDYILYLQISDSLAGTFDVCRWVRIHSPGDPPLAINVTADDETRQGRKMTVRAVQGIIGPIPPGAKCCITGPFTWGGSDVATANHTFIGYLNNQPFAHEPNYYESHADIWGVGDMLDMLYSLPVTLKYAGTPVTWEEVAPSLSTVQFAIWWTLRWRAANALKCFNFTDFSLSGSIGRRQNIPVPQGTIYQQLKALAEMYDANVGSRPDGEIIAQRLPSILQDRSGVATRCTLDDSIYSDVEVTWQRRAVYGDVFHSGFYISDSSLTADVPVQGEAPGIQMPGQGGKTDKKTGKVYETQVDNEIRVGYWLALLNSEYPQIKVTIPNNWDVFVMADLNRVVVNVPASKSPTGSAISITCIPVSFTKRWIPGRRASMTMTLEAETTGTAGEDVPIPPQQTPVTPTTNPLTAYQLTPALSPVPDVGGTVTPITPAGTVHKYPVNGDVIAMSGTANIEITPNFISLYSPHWNDITPGTLSGTAGTFAPQQVVFDPFGRGTAIGLYGLTIDTAGTLSQVQYTPNAALVVPQWTPGTVLGSAVYSVMRTTLAQAGGVLLYTPDTSGALFTLTTNFLTSDGGYVNIINAGDTPDTVGQWVGGIGWQATASMDGSGGHAISVDIKKTFAATTVTAVTMRFHKVNGTFTGTVNDAIVLQHLGSTVGSILVDSSTENGTLTLTWTGSVIADEIDLHIRSSFWAGSGSDGSGEITSVTVNTGTGGAQVVYSSDYGQTFTSPLPISGTTGGGGFDASRNSGASFAGGLGTVYKATSLGGAYSSYASFGTVNPTCIIVPWYRNGSTISGQTTSGTPDILVGLDSGTVRLCWLTGGTAAPAGTFDITPAAGFVPDGPNAVTCSYGKYIAAAGNGTLWESANAGTSWTAVGSFVEGGPLRVRRNDTSTLTGRGVLYALNNGGTINYTSHLVTHGALYPRVMPTSAQSFDTYP